MHDELIFRVRETSLDQGVALIRKVMESATHSPFWNLRVPLPVKIHFGPSWGELREYKPPAL